MHSTAPTLQEMADAWAEHHTSCFLDTDPDAAEKADEALRAGLEALWDEAYSEGRSDYGVLAAVGQIEPDVDEAPNPYRKKRGTD